MHQADLQAKRITFQRLSQNCWAFTAEGDHPIRGMSAKPIRYVVLTHYHAVRVLGASAYRAGHVIASEATRELIRERGEQDMKSENRAGSAGS